MRLVNLSASFCLCFFAFIISGCSSIVDIINPAEIDPPAELNEIEKKLKLKVIWEFNLDMGKEHQYLNLAPKTYKDFIITADSSGTISALSLGNGKVFWANKLNVRASGGPGVAEGLVFIGTRDAEIFALDLKNGNTKWKAKVSSEVLAAPIMSDEVVIVQTIDGHISGIDAKNGKSIWTFKQDLPALTLHGTSTPVISNNKVFCGLANGKMIALDVKTGNLIWEKSVSIPMGRSELERLSDVDATPLIFDGIIFVATYQGEIAALNEKTGALFWRRKFSSYSGMGADRYNIYASDSGGYVWAFDADNGSTRWVQKKLRNRKLSNVAVIGDFLIVGDYEGYIHLLSLKNGAIIGREKVGRDAIKNGIKTSKRLIFVQDTGGRLSALSAKKLP